MKSKLERAENNQIKAKDVPRIKKIRDPSKRLVFGLSTDTLSIKKFPVDDDGEIINSNFNAKTYIKKAYKAYKKGSTYFSYKGQRYLVPKLAEDKLEDMLDKFSNQENIESNE